MHILKLIGTHKRLSAGLVLLAVAVAAYAVFHSPPVKYTYITQTVEPGTLINDVTGTGNLAYGQSAGVNAQTAGTVATVDVQSGQTVAAGAPLYTVQSSALNAQVTKAYETYLQDKQTLANAQINVTQYQNSVNNLEATIAADQQPGATPQQQQGLAAAQAQLNLALQQLAAARLAVSIAATSENADWQSYQSQLSQGTVTAPMAGTVVSVAVSPGQQVSASAGTAAGTSNPSVLIVNPGSLQAVVSLNEVDAAKVTPGQKAQLTFSAINGLALAGTVVSVNPIGTVSQGVVTYNVVIGLGAGNPQLKSGMSVSASITTQYKNNVISAPASAIKTGTSGQYVQILQNGKPQDVNVQTGIVTNNGTEITSGLKPGEKLITQVVSNQPAPSFGNNGPAGNGLLKLGGGGGFKGGRGGPKVK